jgi:hypothetical protein
MPKPRSDTKTMKRSQGMMSLVRWIFEEAGLAAESMALTSGGDRIAEDEDGDWRAEVTTGDVTRKGAVRISTNPWSKNHEGRACWGEDDASSGEKTAPYHNHLGLNRAFRGINGAGSPLS